ncbi:uncharacterized protein LOC135162635 [Diachasmimorpha longicaudata]|uniref:uncharacterized protein LOC135162635 n=1 Tax=Diachasmimorpha longicaudata TaxID=58733 RepID=UPI0030B9098A
MNNTTFGDLLPLTSEVVGIRDQRHFVLRAIHASIIQWKRRRSVEKVIEKCHFYRGFPGIQTVLQVQSLPNVSFSTLLNNEARTELFSMLIESNHAYILYQLGVLVEIWGVLEKNQSLTPSVEQRLSVQLHRGNPEDLSSESLSTRREWNSNVNHSLLDKLFTSVAQSFSLKRNFVSRFFFNFRFASVRSDAKVVFEKEEQEKWGVTDSEITQELVEKPRGNQIVNLNLSAVLLLLLFKAAALGAKYIGTFDGTRGRKFGEENLVTADEMALALGYLIGDTCLYRAACEVPETAREYLGTIDMIVEAMKIFPQTSPINDKYMKKIKEFRKAIEYGELKRCPPDYTCKKGTINLVLPE